METDSLFGLTALVPHGWLPAEEEGADISTKGEAILPSEGAVGERKGKAAVPHPGSVHRFPAGSHWLAPKPNSLPEDIEKSQASGE